MTSLFGRPRYLRGHHLHSDNVSSLNHAEATSPEHLQGRPVATSPPPAVPSAQLGGGAEASRTWWGLLCGGRLGLRTPARPPATAAGAGRKRQSSGESRRTSVGIFCHRRPEGEEGETFIWGAHPLESPEPTGGPSKDLSSAPTPLRAFGEGPADSSRYLSLWKLNTQPHE